MSAEEYGYFFADIIDSYHILEANEEAGKASNQTAAAHVIVSYVKKHNLDPKQVVLTICDADSTLPINYFSYLTHAYTHDKDYMYHFY